jgi:HTH-type transcriptional regulator/antitoxin HigA
MLNTVSKTGSTGRKPAVVRSQYLQLLHEFVPVAIESEAENERALRVAAELMAKDRLSPAEGLMLKLLSVLIENFEQQRYSIGEATPLEVLQELMRARDMQPKDLATAFGSKGVVSEVLSGKRGISRAAARKLAVLFSVPVSVFV